MQFSASTGRVTAQISNIPNTVLDLLNSLRLQANGDVFLTDEDAARFSFTSADLLANDGGITKSFVSVQATSAWGATIAGQNGAFTYDAGRLFDWLGAGETATDSFTYTIRDAAGRTSTATVTVTVAGENDAVTLDEPLPATVRVSELPDGVPGEAASTRGLSGSFVFGDADLSDRHTVSVAPQGAGYLGTFTPVLSERPGAGEVDWTFAVEDSALDFLGADETLTQSYAVTVADGHGGTATKTISVELVGSNDAPVAQRIDLAMRQHDGPLTFAPAFTDADRNDTHTVTIANLSSRAAVTMNPDGTFAYDPGHAFDGLRFGETATDTLVYTVTDNHGGVDKQHVTITVTGDNHDPVAQAINATVKFDGGPVTLAPVFIDPDAGDRHTFEVGSSHGPGGSNLGFPITVTVNPDGTFTYDAHGAFKDLPAGQKFTDSFEYTVVDRYGRSSQATATITIVNDNHDPVAQRVNAAMGAHDGPLTVAPTFTDADPGDTHTVTVAARSERGIPVVMNPDGTFTYDTHGAFTYLHRGQTFEDAFSYEVRDSRGGISREYVVVTVTGDNHDPVAQGLTATIRPDAGPLTLRPVFTDPDAGDTHTLHIVNGASRLGVPVVINPDGTFTYDSGHRFDQLPAGQSVTDTFTYEVDDNHGGYGFATATITIVNANHAPVAQALSATMRADGSVLTLRPVFTDADAGDTHTVSIGDQFPNMALSQRGAFVLLNPDGTITYDPLGKFNLGPGQSTTDSFSYMVRDNHGGSDVKTATITLTGDALPADAPAVAIAETPGVFSDPTPHEVAGAIRTAGAGATASIGAQTVQYLASNGVPHEMLPAQAAGIKGSFHLAAADLGGDGAFHWNFSVQDRNIDFLRGGDRAVLVTDMLIDDHHGHVDHALVTVTLLGADEPPLPPWASSGPDWWA